MHVLRLVYKAFRFIGMVILGYIIIFALSKLFPFLYNLMERLQDGIYSIASELLAFLKG